jgi:hypothetical protein
VQRPQLAASGAPTRRWPPLRAIFYFAHVASR